MAKILVVEDDPDIAGSVCDCLAQQHHNVEQASTMAAAQDRLAVSEYDLVVLDWNLPDGTGLDILRIYRRNGGQAPVLMLTANSAIDHKEAGFNAGTDDYLTKPFILRELGLRVDALLRRTPDFKGDELEFRNIRLSPGKFRVFRGEQEIKLLPKEFALLEFLMRNKGRIFSVDQLLLRVWSSESESLPDTVVTTVKRLRQKIDVPGQPSVIENVRGVGYRLSES